MQNLEGKVAFVTGGASGIGLGLVRAFLCEGMRVAVADYNEEYLEQARAQLGDAGLHYLHVDVSEREELRAAADEAERRFGAIHVLCNNAGVAGGGAVAEPEFRDWDRALGINLGGVVNGIKIIVPGMIARGVGGHVVNTSSMAGITALPEDGGAYTTAKFAVRGLSESLRLSLAPHGIGVSCLCPGLTRTHIMDHPVQSHPGKGTMARLGDPHAMFNTFEGAMEPEEVGAAVVRGIRSNAAYILTHAEFRDEVRELNEALLSAFPAGQSVSEGRLRFEERRRSACDALRRLPVRD